MEHLDHDALVALDAETGQPLPNWGKPVTRLASTSSAWPISIALWNSIPSCRSVAEIAPGCAANLMTMPGH